METKKTIQSIRNTRIISDMVGEQPVAKKTRKPVDSIIPQASTPAPEVLPEEAPTPTPKRSSGGMNFNKIKNTIMHIKPVYSIGFIVIVILVLVLIFVPSPSKDPAEQAKAEAELVKKELSKHMILPENEQIDIRKITNKMEDPFFKDAEVGDYLVIFYKNRIAYIYSIEKDIIINAGVVFIDPKTATTTSTTSNATEE